MSGHSKWHNIQAKKGKADAARGKVFTKLGRELVIAVKEGGPDPAGNSKLKTLNMRYNRNLKSLKGIENLNNASKSLEQIDGKKMYILDDNGAVVVDNEEVKVVSEGIWYEIKNFL